VTIRALSSIEPFDDDSAGPAVHGFLHRPAGPPTRGLVLTHGAGSDCESPLLLAVAVAFAQAGFTVLRCDLPFRQARASGPPSPATAVRDREGLRRAVAALRPYVTGRISLGGHSYGGRQVSVLASDEPDLVDALLLLSYPLHPPRRPTQRRTDHFRTLQVPALFVHGSRDPFGSLVETRDD
jgi:predicted alpha/beta-hydrolase family hydrolase